MQRPDWREKLSQSLGQARQRSVPHERDNAEGGWSDQGTEKTIDFAGWGTFVDFVDYAGLLAAYRTR
jgi:hypothetical protein